VDVLGMKDGFDSVIDAMLKTQTQTIPEEARFKFASVMKTFFDKYFNYEKLKPMLAKIYAIEFTEGELKELTKFYSSEVGKKFAKKSAKLMEKGMLMGQELVEEHQDELQLMIKEEFEKP
jgi:hypothetical protein